MYKPLLGKKIAVLVANGFNEQDIILVQKRFQGTGANVRIVSMDQGLVNSWNGQGWGLNFAADCALNSALSADFSMLVVPGGQRSVEKLKLTAHTKRFIGGFLDADKPLALLGEALGLLAHFDKLDGRSVAGADSLKGAVEQAGAVWSEKPSEADANLFTAGSFEDLSDSFDDVADAMVEHFSTYGAALSQAA